MPVPRLISLCLNVTLPVGPHLASLAKLTGEGPKAVKTAFDLQINPASPGMHLHKLEHARDKRFWSMRVNSELQLVVHRTPRGQLLCYVGHHDRACDWAARRKLLYDLRAVPAGRKLGP